MTVKIDIISGFLGAGKTTLIRKLIEEAFAGEKVAIIENEFGTIGIDGPLLEQTGVMVREMRTGCICCSIVGDFEKAIGEVLKRFSPTRLIIEPSGVGKLSQVAQAVRDVRSEPAVSINMLLAVVNPHTCARFIKHFGPFFKDQVATARAILLSRTQTASPELIEETVATLRGMNPTAPIVTTPWEALEGRRIVELGEGEVQSELEQELVAKQRETKRHAHRHEHAHGPAHSHAHSHMGEDAEDVFESWGMETARRLDAETLRGILAELDREGERFGTVLRAKGIIQGEDGGWNQFQYVPGEGSVTSIRADYTGRLCVIGSGLKRDELAKLFRVSKDES